MTMRIIILLLFLFSLTLIQQSKSHPESYIDRDDSSKNELLDISKKWASYYSLRLYLLKRRKPWLFLPNHGECYQQTCERNDDCCRVYNICDQSAHVCIDCWYGYPCKTSAECCERYPNCAIPYGETTGRCSS